MKLKPMVFAALTALCMTDGAEAALVTRLGGKAIYDDVSNLTWLQDANAGYQVNSLMNFKEANAWAESLNIDGVTGWRLPGGPMESGYGKTASQLGNLRDNVLGGVTGIGLYAIHNANYDLFSNVQEGGYWSGIEFEFDPNFAWFFYIGHGLQDATVKDNRLFAWAVHDGDVGASPVPLPATLFLLAPALGGLGFMRRRAA